MLSPTSVRPPSIVPARARAPSSAASTIASTDGDNTNLTVAQIVQRRFGIEKVLCRVMDPARAAWYAEQGLHTISPTQHAIEMFNQALATEN